MNCHDHGAIANAERQPQRRGPSILTVNMFLLWGLFLGLFGPIVITVWIVLFRLIVPGVPPAQQTPDYQSPFKQQSNTTLTVYK